MKNGLLLVNLGTPDSTKTTDVRRYLREFLSDPKVLDIHPIGRALLLNLIILPTRPAKSAAAYKTIWHPERGSPLLYHSQDLARAVAVELGNTWHVELAMRYGQPSIESALASFANLGISQITVLPLFPQSAASSSGSATARVMELAGQMWDVPRLRFVEEFFWDAGFLDAFAEQGRRHAQAFAPDHVLFSFHGLPERHVAKSAPRAACGSNQCCDQLTEANATCYRAQSYATARGIADRMKPRAWSVSFQSRLGRTPWIKPYTDEVLPQLAAQGVRKLAVMCPAFVADCLETLEEIGDRAKHEFKAAGGEDLLLIPSLNAEPLWVNTVARLARAASAPRLALPIAAARV